MIYRLESRSIINKDFEQLPQNHGRAGAGSLLLCLPGEHNLARSSSGAHQLPSPDTPLETSIVLKGERVFPKNFHKYVIGLFLKVDEIS